MRSTWVFFNGPTDGVLILCGSYLASAYVQDYPKFWRDDLSVGLLPGISRSTAVIAFYVVCVIATVAVNILAVAAAQRSNFRASLAALVPFALSMLGGAAWLLMAAGAASDAALTAFLEAPRRFFWFFGLVFFQLVVHLQLAHICSEPYNPWRWTFLVVALLLAADLVAKCMTGGPLLADVNAFLGCLAVMGLSCIHLCWSLASEMTAILGVRILSISVQSSAKYA